MGGPDGFDDDSYKRILIGTVERATSTDELTARVEHRLEEIIALIYEGLVRDIVHLSGAESTPILVQNNARAMAIIRCVDTFHKSDVAVSSVSAISEEAKVALENIASIELTFTGQEDLDYHFLVVCTFSLPNDPDTVHIKKDTIIVQDIMSTVALDSLEEDAVRH